MINEPKMDFYEMHNPNTGFEAVGEIVGLRYVNKSELDMYSDDETQSKDSPDARDL